MRKNIMAALIITITTLVLLCHIKPALALQDGDFTYELISDGITTTAQITGYTGQGGYIIIPSMVKEWTIPVTSIGRSAFSGMAVTSVDIPAGVITIEQGAFSACQSLTVVHIGETVMTIGPNAFASCTELTSINIPDSVTSIGPYAFYCCSGLKSIGIPDSVASIGEWAFTNCIQLESVTLPNNISVIEHGVFSYCWKLNNVLVPSTVENIGPEAFRECHGLTHIVIPEGVKNIDSSAFMSCYNLINVILPASLQNIGSKAFSQCGAVSMGAPAPMTIRFNYATTHITTEQWVFSAWDYPIQPNSIIIAGDPSTAQDYAVAYGCRFKELGVDCYDPFPANPDVFNKYLALKAAQFSMMAYEEYDYNGDSQFLTADKYGTVVIRETEPVFLKVKLTQEGFINIKNYRYGENGEDKVAYVLATRTVYDVENKPHTMIAVIIRGTVGSEWYGNFDITGINWDESQIVHKSFYEAEQDVLSSLKKYASDYGISDPYLLITGHSRGAAVANILADHITTQTDPLSRTPDSVFLDSNVFAYTFAAPNVTRDPRLNLQNIFNFSFLDDFVPSLPLNKWGYNKSGQPINAIADDLYDDQVNPAFKLKMKEYVWDKNKALDAEFNSYRKDAAIEHMNKLWPSPDLYYTDTDFIGNDGNPYNDIPAFVFFKEFVAPAAIAPLVTNTSKLINKGSGNPTYGPIVDFFFWGSAPLVGFVGDTHNMYTYYTALKYEGFDNAYVRRGIDATLSDLTVNGTTVNNFSSGTLTYNVTLPAGTTIIPNVSATVTDLGKAIAIIKPATSLPGFAEVLVIAENGFNTHTYKIYFVIETKKNNDATVADLKIDGKTVTGFTPATMSYIVELPAGTTIVPTVAATVTDTGKATAVVTNAINLPGTTTVVVTAEDGTTTQTYTINFTVAVQTLQWIAITTPPTKTQYVTGQSLDLSGLVVTGTYNDDSTAILTITLDNISGFDSSSPVANQTLTVTVDGKTASYNISITAGPEGKLIDVASTWCYVSADDINQNVGDVTITANPGYDSIAGPYTATVIVTLPERVTFSDNGTSTKTFVDVWLSESAPFYLYGGNDLVIDVDTDVSGSILADVRVYVTNGAEYLLDETESQVIAKVVADNTDATLSDLSVDGTTILGFDPATTIYSEVLQAGTTIVPTVTTSVNDTGGATAEITAAASLPGTTTILVTAADGVTTLTYTINFIVVQSVTVTPASPNVNVDATPLQITVPVDVDNASLTTSPVDGAVFLPQISVQASTSIGDVTVYIINETEVTGPTDWDGIINLPQVVDPGSVTVTPESGYEAIVSGAIKIGLPSTTLEFNQPVRIRLAGQGGKKAGWILNETFTPINYEMPSDTAEALEINSDGYLTVGSDLVIWTTHFTTFVAYTETSLTGFTLRGQVLVEGDDLTEGQTHYSGGVSIELKQGEEIKYSTISSEAEDLAGNGSFIVTGIAAGDYTVVVSKAGYLTRSFALTINSDLALATTSDLYHNRIYLWGGDIVSDEYHVIAAADVNYILSKFNSDSTQVGFDPQVDIVKDQYNVISAMDVNLMLSNFNKNSTQYPADIVY